MFVSRPNIIHGKDLRACTTMADTRIRGTANLVASNIHTLSAHTSDVTAVAYSKNVLATCSADKTVRLYDTKDYAELPSSPLTGHCYLIHCCAFSPSGSPLATCSTDGTLRLWDVKTGQCLASLCHPSKSPIRVCKFSRDGSMLVSGGDDDSACLWRVADRKLIRSFKGHEESVVSATFTPDSSYLVTGSSGIDFGGDLLVWDALYGHGKFLKRITSCHDLAVSCCDFSPTYGSAGEELSTTSLPVRKFLLATGGKDNLVKLWNFEAIVGSVDVKVTLETMLPGHTESVQWLCFSPNGKYIASCSLDKTVRLWTVDKKQCILDISEHSSYVTFCAFSLDNRHLASASNDKTVKIWQLSDTSNIMNNLNGVEESEEKTTTTGPDLVAMATWSVEEVSQWLSSLGLAEYQDTFRENAIDGKELLTLSAEDLQTLGVVALGHRNKILRARTATQEEPIPGQRSEPEHTPNEFLCPITQELMRDPVIAADGYTYDRPAITSWMEKEQRSPLTNVELVSTQLTPNRTLKMMIQKFLQAS